MFLSVGTNFLIACFVFSIYFGEKKVKEVNSRRVLLWLDVAIQHLYVLAIYPLFYHVKQLECSRICFLFSTFYPYLLLLYFTPLYSYCSNENDKFLPQLVFSFWSSFVCSLWVSAVYRRHLVITSGLFCYLFFLFGILLFVFDCREFLV